MAKKTIIKLLLYGFLSWLIPFVISCLFFIPGGKLTIPYDLFKSIMIVVGSFTGCYLLYRYFLLIDSHYTQHGVIVGMAWFAINIFLDVLALIPMMKTTFNDYFISIGLRYTIIFIISTSMGLLLDRKETQM